MPYECSDCDSTDLINDAVKSVNPVRMWKSKLMWVWTRILKRICFYDLKKNRFNVFLTFINAVALGLCWIIVRSLRPGIKSHSARPYDYGRIVRGFLFDKLNPKTGKAFTRKVTFVKQNDVVIARFRVLQASPWISRRYAAIGSLHASGRGRSIGLWERF
jgi:hypothetical protein